MFSSLLKERPVTYKVHSDGTFTIENYAAAPPFANFLPGVAGPFGVPLWAFYVNRGQCIASFGASDKNRAIMEFVPANRAYEQTPFRGFRTFLKVIQKKDFEFYEPFQNWLYEQKFDLRQWLHIRPWGFSIEEKNMSLGLEVQVDYYGIPQESFAALARLVTVRNLSLSPITVELLDGLPKIVPFGLNDHFLKNMSRTAEAWMQAQKAPSKEGINFFKLSSEPYDGPVYQPVEGANFYASFNTDAKGKVHYPQRLIDPDPIFGTSSDFSDPRGFLTAMPFVPPKDQVCEGRTACAFSFLNFDLQPSQAVTLYSLVGQTQHPHRVQQRLGQILSTAYFDDKRRVNQKLISNLLMGVASISASKEYDAYCKQTFLDNALRGGYPFVIPTKKKDFVFPIYSRKQGDLERDYNEFVMHPTYLSQGDGHYRDMIQNRRTSVFFEPRVKDSDVRTFFDLLQTDGFNPLVIKESKLKFHSLRKLRDKLKPLLSKDDLEKVMPFFESSHSPGKMMKLIEDTSSYLNGNHHAILEVLLQFSERSEAAEPSQGYWIDHWFYSLDLLENYLSVYPEERENILFRDRGFTFFDNPIYVKSRKEKYRRMPNGSIRQYEAVARDPEKEALIGERKDEPNKVRTRRGKGKIYKTTLAAKLVCLIVNKYASLDPEGIGMEMEADRPGWLDSLNGLPMLLGSSISGTLELLRLVDFLEGSLRDSASARSVRIRLPEEVMLFLLKLKRATERYLSSASRSRSMVFWSRTHEFKEDYWRQTRFGLSGRERMVPARKLRAILCLLGEKLREGLGRAYDPKKEICPTYFINEVAQYRTVKVRSRRNGSLEKREIVVPRKFKRRSLPPFLEGPMHALRVEKNSQKAYEIYNAVRSSELFDRKLGMYRISASLDGESPEIGRIRAFTPGWLENQAIYVHMEYKFLLALLKGGLAEPFFADLRTALVPFQDPKLYGRSVFENSSFIVSSVFADKKLHGKGYVARLSGATSEFLDMWLTMNVGPKPFFIDESKKLALRLRPLLPAWLFTDSDTQREISLRDGIKISLFLPKHSYAFVFLGHTLVTYHNPRRLSTYGAKKAVVKRITFTNSKGQLVMLNGDVLPDPYARRVREGAIQRLDVELG